MHVYEKKGRYIINFTDIPSKRAEMSEIPVLERKRNFREVDIGFSEDVAVSEAKRCLSCRRCLGCALCWAECKPEAINFDLPNKNVEVQVDKVVLTSGLERTNSPIGGNIDNKHMNVVTDLQVERMLAVTGPTDGLILRPQDGEIPKSIAFLQGFGGIEERIRDAALIFGINEALLARRKIDGLETTIISPDMDSFQTKHSRELGGVSGICLINGTVLQATEVGAEKNIRVEYQTDVTKEAYTFDLVVLLTQPQLPSSVADVARHLGVEVGYGDFLGNAGQVVESGKHDILIANNP